jgi:hypothetical protein
MRNIVLGGIAALTIGGAASSALAMEAGTFQNRLNGATIGLPLAALPPPGLYSGLETAYLGLLPPNGGKGNQVPGLAAPAVANAVPILYVPGWNFLGANYSMSVVQAFYFAGLAASYGSLTTGPTAGLNTEEILANTTWTPINLSWNLGGGWFVGAAFSFMGPDGSRWASGANVDTNPDYWTFEPSIAVAYLANNWVLAANFFYDINTQSRGTCCVAAGLTGGTVTSGNALYGDFTAVYKFGKWEIGPVAYFEAQTTSDSGTACAIAGSCGNFQTFDLGLLVGYDFGPVDFQVWWTQSVSHQNSIDGNIIWSRIGFKIWGPDAPRPLVAKN